MDKIVAELLASTAAMAEALKANTAILERVVAGQEAALAKLDGAKAPTTGRGRAKKDEAEPAAGNAEPAATESPAVAATTAYKAPVIADADALKAHISAWTGGTEDTAERQKRVELLKAIAAKFGVAPKFGELLPHASKAVFLVDRAKAMGVDAVDLKAEYDFDGHPEQEVAAAAESEDEFG